MDTATPLPTDSATATITSTVTSTPSPLATVVEQINVLTTAGANAADSWLVLWATALWFLLFAVFFWMAMTMPTRNP